EIQEFQVSMSEEMQVFKTSMKQEMQEFQISIRRELHETRVSLKEEIEAVRYTLENDTHRRISIIAENHINLNHKLSIILEHQKTDEEYWLKVDILMDNVRELKAKTA
ncbi:MAG: hypothetical protein Q4D16_22195, partial [Eubacteriales bacterium]|nr:hypothetical protein [Eubacteriales bacterium]